MDVFTTKNLFEVPVGKGIKPLVDIAQLPDVVMDHVIFIGLKNILQDCHAGLPDAEAREKVEKKLAAMYAGEVRKAREGGARSDPLAAECIKLARAKVLAEVVDAKGKIKATNWAEIADQLPGKSVDEVREALIETIAKTTEIVERAKAIVAAKAGAPKIDLTKIKF